MLVFTLQEIDLEGSHPTAPGCLNCQRLSSPEWLRKPFPQHENEACKVSVTNPVAAASKEIRNAK